MHWDNGTYSILNIPYVQVKHFKDFGGKYTLTMSNSVGSYSADYELVPDGKLLSRILCVSVRRFFDRGAFFNLKVHIA